MYNIHSHYENVYSYLRTIYKEPVLLYLHPFGATDPENIELMHSNGSGLDPVFLCYDQEPLIQNFNDKLFKHIREQWGDHRLIVLLNTEKNSSTKTEYLKKYNVGLQSGKMYEANFEVVLGYEIARKSQGIDEHPPNKTRIF